MRESYHITRLNVLFLKRFSFLQTLCEALVSNNAREQVTWLHSDVSDDRKKAFYDAPSLEAIRSAANCL